MLLRSADHNLMNTMVGAMLRPSSIDKDDQMKINSPHDHQLTKADSQ